MVLLGKSIVFVGKHQNGLRIWITWFVHAHGYERCTQNIQVLDHPGILAMCVDLLSLWPTFVSLRVVRIVNIAKSTLDDWNNHNKQPLKRIALCISSLYIGIWCSVSCFCYMCLRATIRVWIETLITWKFRASQSSFCASSFMQLRIAYLIWWIKGEPLTRFCPEHL